MKVLLINGSPKTSGNTAYSLSQMADVFQAEGIETEIIQVGNQAIRGCSGCQGCKKIGKCVFDDLVNDTAEKLRHADGMIVASPVYCSSPNGTLISFLDRLFYSARTVDKRMKVGASVAVARRGGCSSSIDVMNKYFSLAGMPIAPSTYWNFIHGSTPGEAAQDAEGICTVRNLAKNTAFLMRSIAMGKEALGLPVPDPVVRTNFIR